MQKLGKLNLKINVIRNGLEKYIGVTINNKLSFIGNFQFFSDSLDSSVKNLGKYSFKHLRQEFANNVLGVCKQKGFYPYEYMSNFEKFKEDLHRKGKFYISLAERKNTGKEYDHALNV